MDQEVCPETDMGTIYDGYGDGFCLPRSQRGADRPTPPVLNKARRFRVHLVKHRYLDFPFVRLAGM